MPVVATNISRLDRWTDVVGGGGKGAGLLFQGMVVLLTTTFVGFWVDYLALGSVMLIVGLMELFALPFHRMFYLNDPAIQYPHALVERVSVVWLLIYAVLVPLVIILLWAAIARPGWAQTHATLLAFLIAVGMTTLITDAIKNAAGRPRPDLISRCKPPVGTPTHVLLNYTVCTETNHHRLHDGWRSFPSGHSSLSFAGLGFLSLFAAGQIRSFRPHMSLFRLFVPFVPFVGAGMIAMSRLADYRHDVFDVSVGSALGFGIALLAYRRYYPSLFSTRCGKLRMSDEVEVELRAGRYGLVPGGGDGGGGSEEHRLWQGHHTGRSGGLRPSEAGSDDSGFHQPFGPAPTGPGLRPGPVPAASLINPTTQVVWTSHGNDGALDPGTCGGDRRARSGTVEMGIYGPVTPAATAVPGVPEDRARLLDSNPV